MAHIRPFAAVRYARKFSPAFSDLIAPPYDVLDESGKAALQERHANNIVTVDLPHLPAKAAGPDAVYERAAVTLNVWLSGGVLHRDTRAALYPYTQSFDHGGRTLHRRGFIALVRLSPLGAGQVMPHEKTYSGPIEDRLKLMRATGMQLSPIFGLFSDPRNEVTSLLYHNLGRPELSGIMQGVHNDLWRVTDGEIENKVIDLIGQRPIYIADGHHRYTTALQYQQEMAQKNVGVLPENHPANYCMFVLVGMQDDGLLILPTHRLIGGLSAFNIQALAAALGDSATITPTSVAPDQLAAFANTTLPRSAPHTFGLYDGATKATWLVEFRAPERLAQLEPDHSDAWRRLDVAILQRFLLDEILQPTFAGGAEPIRGYTADASTISAQVDGQRYQIALLLRATPLHALEELARHGEVMPQKSTYFYPKLATGMALYPLR